LNLVTKIVWWASTLFIGILLNKWKAKETKRRSDE